MLDENNPDVKSQVLLQVNTKGLQEQRLKRSNKRKTTTQIIKRMMIQPILTPTSEIENVDLDFNNLTS